MDANWSWQKPEQITLPQPRRSCPIYHLSGTAPFRASKLRPVLVLWEDMADVVVAAVTKAVPRSPTMLRQTPGGDNIRLVKRLIPWATSQPAK